MPDNRAEQEPSQEEPCNLTPAESADGQNQEGPRGHGGKTFLEHARESMEEHETLGRLLA